MKQDAEQGRKYDICDLICLSQGLLMVTIELVYGEYPGSISHLSVGLMGSWMLTLLYPAFI